jgi:hypothetical protein
VSHVFTTYMVAKVGAHLYPLPSWEPIVQTVTHLRQPRAAAHHSAPANGCAHVETGLIRGTVHYVVEDQPEAVADLIQRYA